MVQVQFAQHLDRGTQQIRPDYGWVRVSRPGRDFYQPELDSDNPCPKEVRLSVQKSWGLVGLTPLGRRIFSVEQLLGGKLFELWTGRPFSVASDHFLFRWQTLASAEEADWALTHLRWRMIIGDLLRDAGEVEFGPTLDPIS